MVKVSVLIPVYNVEKYLRACMDNIVNQTFKDIEIICIDDGSTDGSLEILKEYERTDSRIKVFTQENQGQGATRNNAISLANGKYIYFMDSDDTLELNGINDLYNISEEKSLDLIVFKLINVDEETGRKYPEKYYEMEFLKKRVGGEVFNYADVGGDCYQIAVSPQGKFFKTDLISDIRFDESHIFEDNPFFIEALFKADRVYFHEEYLCNRLRRKGSLMTRNSSFMDVIPISNQIVEITKKYGHYEGEFKDGLFNKKIFSTYYRFTVVDDSLKQDFFNNIKEDFASYKDEVESGINLNPLNEYIFEQALKCEDYSEFNFSVALFKKDFEYTNKINELKENIRHIKHNEIARFDIRNRGNENNSFIILNNSDENSKEDFPPWLSDETGSGAIIESDCGNLDLKLKMINDGEFNLLLKSIDLRDDDGNRVKCCIDYTSLRVNGEENLTGHNAFWHDDLYSFTKNVVDSEIVDIHIEWITYDKLDILVGDMAEKTRKHERLTNQTFKLMNKMEKKDKQIKKLKKQLKEASSPNKWSLRNH